MRLRVATWNIHGARDASIEEISEVLRELRAEVVCLNEVPRRLAAPLARRVEMEAFTAASVIGPYGNAILTSREVASWRRFRFSRVPRKARRDAAIVTLTEGPTIAAIHLNLRAAERARHIGELLEALPSDAVVAGDMNEQPGGTVWRTLDARLSDMAVADPEPTFPAGAPTARIDGIWVPETATAIACRVHPTDRSDHRPVVADVEF